MLCILNAGDFDEVIWLVQQADVTWYDVSLVVWHDWEQDCQVKKELVQFSDAP